MTATVRNVSNTVLVASREVGPVCMVSLARLSAHLFSAVQLKLYCVVLV